MKKRLKVMLLVHDSLIPPDDLNDYNDPRMETYRTEYDIKTTLLELGHRVEVIGVDDDITQMRHCISDMKPDIAFNLTEEFNGRGEHDYYINSYLELIKMPYTGCNPAGLFLSRDKSLSKILLLHHGIKVPEFKVFPRKAPLTLAHELAYPLIVKSLLVEGSIGITQASIVNNVTQLECQIAKIHKQTKCDAIAEVYIEGREFYVTVIGNQRCKVLPIRELVFKRSDKKMHKIASFNVKWNDDYRERWGIDYQFARKLPNGVAAHIDDICTQAYKILGLSGYARFDLRMNDAKEIFVLEANPNPGLANNEDCAYSAEKWGLSYPEFIQHILKMGFQAHKNTHNAINT